MSLVCFKHGCYKAGNIYWRAYKNYLGRQEKLFGKTPFPQITLKGADAFLRESSSLIVWGSSTWRSILLHIHSLFNTEANLETAEHISYSVISHLEGKNGPKMTTFIFVPKVSCKPLIVQEETSHISKFQLCFRVMFGCRSVTRK